MQVALYQIAPQRQFARLPLVDAICGAMRLDCRSLLEGHGMAAKMPKAVNIDLLKRGQLQRQGAMDAAISRCTGTGYIADQSRYRTVLADARVPAQVVQ